jgi:hypothetical protein
MPQYLIVQLSGMLCDTFMIHCSKLICYLESKQLLYKQPNTGLTLFLCKMISSSKKWYANNEKWKV